MNRKTAAAILPRAAVMVAGVSLAVMPVAPSMAIMPTPELRPMRGPVEVRTPGRRR